MLNLKEEIGAIQGEFNKRIGHILNAIEQDTPEGKWYRDGVGIENSLHYLRQALAELRALANYLRLRNTN